MTPEPKQILYVFFALWMSLGTVEGPVMLRGKVGEIGYLFLGLHISIRPCVYGGVPRWYTRGPADVAVGCHRYLCCRYTSRVCSTKKYYMKATY